MHSLLREATQSSPGVVLRQHSAHPSKDETTVPGKATAAATQPLSLPEDVVTLSSSNHDPSPRRKASQPVSNEEKQALLGNNPREGFSVYG